MKHFLYFILLSFFSCSVKTNEHKVTQTFDESQIDYDFTVCGYVNKELFAKYFYKDSLPIYSYFFERSDTVNPNIVQQYLYRNQKIDSILYINSNMESVKDFYLQYDYLFRYNQEIDFFINELKHQHIKIPFKIRNVLGLELYQMSMFMSYYELNENRNIELIDTVIGRVRKIKLNYIDTVDISFQAEKLQLGSKFQPENNLLLQYSVDVVNNLPISDEIIFTTWKMQRKYRYSRDKQGNYSVYIDQTNVEDY